MTLTKRELVIRISEETGLIQNQVFDVVQKTLNYITESLAKGDKVELRNFGVFEVKTRNFTTFLALIWIISPMADYLKT